MLLHLFSSKQAPQSRSKNLPELSLYLQDSTLVHIPKIHRGISQNLVEDFGLLVMKSAAITELLQPVLRPEKMCKMRPRRP